MIHTLIAFGGSRLSIESAYQFTKKMSSNNGWQQAEKAMIESSVLNDLKGNELPLVDCAVVVGSVDCCVVVLVLYVEVASLDT